MRAIRSAAIRDANAEWHHAIAGASHDPIRIAIYTAVSPGCSLRIRRFASADVRAKVTPAAAWIGEAIVADAAANAACTSTSRPIAGRSSRLRRRG